MTLFQGKYRNESVRCPNWDYSSRGHYFVTICTKNRQHYFGKINYSGRMELSAAGVIAQQCWNEIPDHFPDVILDEFIIMPDHIHGIIEISRYVGPQNFAAVRRKNIFGPQSRNIPSIIRGFKVGVSVRLKNVCDHFQWQSRYYERIIRGDDELGRIRRYIINNPQKWASTVYLRK